MGRLSWADGVLSGSIRWRCWRVGRLLSRLRTLWRGSLLVRPAFLPASRRADEYTIGGPTKLPRVLLIHIPLYRAEGTSCGPGRESRRGIRQGEGLNYQNELDEKTSNWLLKSLNPTLVYSYVSLSLICTMRTKSSAGETTTIPALSIIPFPPQHPSSPPSAKRQ